MSHHVRIPNKVGGYGRRGGLRVIGYHGTSQSRASDILATGFRESSNRYDWLGRGVYFFEEDATRAWQWARQRFPDEPAVIGAALDLSNVLDLHSVDSAEILRAVARSLDELYRARGKDLPRNTAGRHDFDCALIDMTCDVYQKHHEYPSPVDVVCGVFEEGTLIHPNSSIRCFTHVQLAVREMRAIIGSWIHEP